MEVGPGGQTAAVSRKRKGGGKGLEERGRKEMGDVLKEEWGELKRGSGERGGGRREGKVGERDNCVCMRKGEKGRGEEGKEGAREGK